ncbi:MAG: hypothetical protein H3C53_12865 [Trueperaceae bacterium]|nr:hypothetical protein [Trueperaceae bacterium]
MDDASRFKIWLASRQVCKSLALTLEAVLDAVQRRSTWVFLSAGERQSLELAEKKRLHLEAIHIAAAELNVDFLDQDGTHYKQLLMRLQNGTQLIFLLANPSTARGYPANVALDKFAFHPDSAAIWVEVFPSITESRGLKLRVASTPQGKSAVYYRWWEGAERLGGRGVWTRHFTDNYQAVVDCLPGRPVGVAGGPQRRAGVAAGVPAVPRGSHRLPLVRAAGYVRGRGRHEGPAAGGDRPDCW